MALSLRDNTAVSVAFTLSGRLSEGGGKGKAKRALPRLFRRDVILQLVEAPNELGLPCLITLERLTLADDPGGTTTGWGSGMSVSGVAEVVADEQESLVSRSGVVEGVAGRRRLLLRRLVLVNHG